jgi:hypothetical protein
MGCDPSGIALPSFPNFSQDYLSFLNKTYNFIQNADAIVADKGFSERTRNPDICEEWCMNESCRSKTN